MTDRGSAIKRTVLDIKVFGLIIGLGVSALVIWGAFGGALFFERWDRTLSDRLFTLRTIVTPQVQQEGAVVQAENTKVSPDILILGIDDTSLDTIGKWPFGRNYYADFLNSLTRVQDANQRERSVFFDFFFLSKDPIPENDWAFVQAMDENQRVFLETIYSESDPTADSEVQFQRLEALQARSGTFSEVKGPWKSQTSFMTLQAPLLPFAQVSRGNGFATLAQDDDEIFRRQNMVSKVTKVLEETELSALKADTSDYEARYQRYVYTNKQGRHVTLPSPLTQEVLAGLPALLGKDGLTRQVEVEGTTDLKDIYVIQKVQDIFIPSITLALALDHWHKKPADIEVVLGSHVLIPSPELYDPDTGTWSPAQYPEVRIPIDAQGAMTINYMGRRSSSRGNEYQTFPVRPFVSYSSKAPGIDPQTWPQTRQLGGRILMVGAFSSGMADDEKNTPFGQMYGVEIHANALNTILMRSFLVPVPTWIVLVVLVVLSLLVAWLAGRFSPLVSFPATIVLLLLAFSADLVLFEFKNLVYPFSTLLTSVGLTFILVSLYRLIFVEREKWKVRNMFGKYVSPDVVTVLLQHPPELGGEDKELTVLFSDIRKFTSLSEHMTSQELVNHLNVYLTAMTDVIHEYKGTLDKYVGDEIMCFWGAPLVQEDHALLAAQCALRMMEVLDELNERWPAERKLNIGIGLNSGVMTVANMGSPGRMNYTLMGDEVNLGARLEGTNKVYGTNIIMSESTFHYLKDKAVARELDIIQVKGKSKSVLIYELVDFIDGLRPPVVTAKKK